jgi:hypothetical protein
MWANNFQNFNDNYKPILSAEITTPRNGRVNLFDDNENNVKNRIKMFERSTPSIKSSTDYRNATSTIQQESNISLMFFSAKNIQYIQDTLKKEIYTRSNGLYRLLPQNEDDLKTIMRAYFLQYVEYDLQNETGELKRLNGLVLDFLIPRLMNESESYVKYIRDQSTLVMPFDRSVAVDRDWRENEIQPFLFNWT